MMTTFFVIRFMSNGQYYDGSNLVTQDFNDTNSTDSPYSNPIEFDSIEEAEECIEQDIGEYTPVEIVKIYKKGIKMQNKRGLAVTGCKTPEDIGLVCTVLDPTFNKSHGRIHMDDLLTSKMLGYEKNTVYDDGGDRLYYYNWNCKAEADIVAKCRHLTFEEFLEEFKDDVEEIKGN